MNVLIVLLGTLLQHCSGNVVHISNLKNDTRITDYEVNPGSGGVIIVPGKLDLEIGGPGGTITINPGTDKPTENPNNPRTPEKITPGPECGSTTQMHAGNIVQVFSTNFGIANYYNNEACTWKFEGNQCTLSAHCPCAEIPRSWECLGDYLKISTDLLENQRFCGGNRPGQPIFSETDFISVRFRSDSKITAAGFTCFVRCEGPGMQIPLPEVTCPKSQTSGG